MIVLTHNNKIERIQYAQFMDVDNLRFLETPNYTEIPEIGIKVLIDGQDYEVVLGGDLRFADGISIHECRVFVKRIDQ